MSPLQIAHELASNAMASAIRMVLEPEHPSLTEQKEINRCWAPTQQPNHQQHT